MTRPSRVLFEPRRYPNPIVGGCRQALLTEQTARPLGTLVTHTSIIPTLRSVLCQAILTLRICWELPSSPMPTLMPMSCPWDFGITFKGWSKVSTGSLSDRLDSKHRLLCASKDSSRALARDDSCLASGNTLTLLATELYR